MLECACGTFAIGRCVMCRIPVCAHHSELLSDRRLCMRHAAEQRSAARATAVADRSNVAVAERAAYEQDRQTWIERCRDVLATLGDPVARQVAAVREATSLKQYEPGPSKVEGIAVDRRLLGDVLPELEQPDLWDDDVVQSWFLRAVKRAPSRLGYGSKPRFGGQRRSIDGYLLLNALSDEGNKIVNLVVLVADGRRLSRMGRDDVFDVRDRPDLRLNAHALCQMADVVELPRFPPGPVAPLSGLVYPDLH